VRLLLQYLENEMNISVLETQLVMIWYFTDTINGCRAAVETLARLERTVDTIEASDMINDAKDLAFYKGQEMRLRDNQIRWAEGEA